METDFFLVALYDKMWHVIEIGWCWIFGIRVRNNMFLCLVLVELKAQCYHAYACESVILAVRVICHEVSPTRRFGQQNPE